MKDDEFDALLRDAAETYNVPPEPPRDAMWLAIAQARSTTAVTPFAMRRAPRWIAASAGIAAILMAGIVIGRASRGPVGALTTVAATSTAVVAPLSGPGANSVEVALPSVPGNDVAPDASTSATSAGRGTRR